MDKGFKEQNCFAFDSFPRRVKFGYKSGVQYQRKVPREIWPQFINSHDELHTEYRKHGGQVTLLMGNNAENAWKDVIATENVEAVRLEHAEAFEIWAEISRKVSFSLWIRLTT